MPVRIRPKSFILLIFAAVSAVGFFVTPGHSYALGGTQIFAPMLERLTSPGMLSRDLVATHPNVTYTIYDEVTLFLHETGRVPLAHALALQQFLFRVASVAGVYLLARAARVGWVAAVVIASALQFGVLVLGPGIALVDPEATPTAFAVGAVLLAAGLFATGRPLSAALAGGVALVYDARIAAPFWILILVAGLSDQRFRPLLRASFPVFAVFVLLLANVAQLQPGVPEAHGLFDTTAAPIAAIQRFRTPEVFVGLWSPQTLLWVVALGACCYWAVKQTWPSLDAPSRWLFAGLPSSGALSVPLSYLLIDRADWAMGPQIQPARTLLFTAVFTFVCAGAIAARQRKMREILPALAIALLLLLSGRRRMAKPPAVDTADLARWAEENTWGGSMFLFPDVDRGLTPGLFRAEARRAVWVDWQSGVQSDYFDSFADEWYRRWQDTMAGTYTSKRLTTFLSLPIDYYVLGRDHRLAGVTPVFANRAFVVYDAGDLRKLNGLSP